MANSEKKVYLYHGDCDYLIFKEFKTLKKKFETEGTNISEFDGAKSLHFDSIYNALQSADLFMSKSAVVIRQITDARSFFPFVEDLVELINKSNPESNDLYIFNYGKILKTSKIYKSIDKNGEVNELNQPKEEDTVKNISKSLNITSDAAKALYEYTTGNLFQIGNEVQKLRNYLLAKNKEKITLEDVDLICIKSFSQENVWGIGSKFLNHKLQPTDYKLKAELLKDIDNLLSNNVAPMQILYSFYQNALNAIKMKKMILQGKNFRDCMSLGYFFVKEFFEKREKMKIDELLQTNSDILNIEYQIKSGLIDEVAGLRKLVFNL